MSAEGIQQVVYVSYRDLFPRYEGQMTEFLNVIDLLLIYCLGGDHKSPWLVGNIALKK